MPELLDLCYDVLIQILEEINPEDLAACAQTSKSFNEFIKKNNRLYKAHYLKNFDDPRRRPTNPEPEWVPTLQRLVRCQKMLQSADNDLKRDEFEFVATSVDSLITTASRDEFGNSHNQRLIAELFQHISQNHDAFMCRSSLFERGGTRNNTPADDEESRQLSAKIHVLFGIPSSNVGRRVLETHPFARSRVYDLRNYTDATKWGPYRDDGSMRIDWEMVESLMIVIGHNSSSFCQRSLTRFSPPWLQPLEGVVPERGREVPEYPLQLLKEPDVPLDLKDPYRVEGIWARIVCFLDYNDLYRYNFSADAMKVPSDQPRDALVAEEAIRHIIMDLHITDVTAPGQFDNPALPIVHFTGKSKSVDAAWDPNANSGIKGTVRLTPQGDVRWQTVSVFQGGEERWRSDGVQIGGLRARRGVVGTWFDKDFDAHGPAGPTAFWKIAEKDWETDDESDDDGSEGSWHV